MLGYKICMKTCNVTSCKLANSVIKIDIKITFKYTPLSKVKRYLYFLKQRNQDSVKRYTYY